jgi:drug/metabolite transporter (DMT)-like permease
MSTTPISHTKTAPFLIIMAASWWAIDLLFRLPLLADANYVPVLPVVTLGFLEALVNIIFFGYFLYRARFQIPTITKSQWFALAYVGVAGTAVANIFLNAGYSADISAFSLLYQLQPIWTLVSAYFLLKERIQPQTIVLMAVALIGAYLITFKDIVPDFLVTYTNSWGLTNIKLENLPVIDKVVAGAICGLACSAIWGLGTTISKYSSDNTSFQITTGFRYLFGAIAGFLIILGSIGFNAIFRSGNVVLASDSKSYSDFLVNTFAGVNNFDSFKMVAQPEILKNLLIIGVVGIPFMALYYYALNRTYARVSTFCEMFFPVMSILFAYFKDQNWNISNILNLSNFVNFKTPTQWVGMVLLLGTIVITNLKTLFYCKC